MRRIVLFIALCIPGLAQAQLLIDNFSTNQAGGTEIGSVPAAIGGVRHLTPPPNVTFLTTVSGVSGGTFRCGVTMNPLGNNGPFFVDCTATWDGNDNGVPEIASGILGTGTSGGGLDLATGAIGIEFNVNASFVGRVEFRAQNYDGSQCTLASDFSGSSTLFLPFDVTGCLDANGQLPTDVRGISLTLLAGGETVFTASVGNVTVVPIPSYTIGGTLSGLAPGSSVTLQNSGADDLVLDADGMFTFATEVIDQDSYAVTVATQPSNPVQLCTVTNGSGQVDGAPVDTVDVQCEPAFSIGGTVSGLQTPGLILDLNNQSALLFEQDGAYTFPLGVADGGGYTVTTLLSPPDHLCMVTDGGGTVAGANVTNADVTCTTNILFRDGLETLSNVPIVLD